MWFYPGYVFAYRPDCIYTHVSRHSESFFCARSSHTHCDSSFGNDDITLARRSTVVGGSLGVTVAIGTDNKACTNATSGYRGLTAVKTTLPRTQTFSLRDVYPLHLFSCRGHTCSDSSFGLSASDRIIGGGNER